jgi:hypothetical protein
MIYETSQPLASHVLQVHGSLIAPHQSHREINARAHTSKPPNAAACGTPATTVDT